MIDIRLQARHLDDNLILHLGWVFRAGFALLAVVVAGGMLSLGRLSPVPAVLLVVLLLGALYEERWVVDRGQQTITARHGLLVLARTRSWSLADVVAVGVGVTDGPGGGIARPPGRSFLRYSLIMGDATPPVRVEIRRVRAGEDPLELPGLLAAALGVPLEDRPV